MPEPLAFFITWTTYGTWLPGDDRGWVKRSAGFQLPNPKRKVAAQKLITESECHLDQEQRTLVEQTIAEHCRIRNWHLHAVNCRSNHVHVVVTSDCNPEIIEEQLKAWCTRKLKELQRRRNQPDRTKWWTERGSQRYIDDEDSLEAAIRYVVEFQ